MRNPSLKLRLNAERVHGGRCAHCGKTDNDQSASLLIDQLVQSHTELCTALRLAGRQILRNDQQGGVSLEKIRKVLKRAENVRRTTRWPLEAGENPASAERSPVEFPSTPEFDTSEAFTPPAARAASIGEAG